MTTARTGDIQSHDPGDGGGARPHASVSLRIPLDSSGPVAVRLEDGRVATVIIHPASEAQDLANARRARGRSGLRVAKARPVAHAVADALVAAGIGGS